MAGYDSIESRSNRPSIDDGLPQPKLRSMPLPSALQLAGGLPPLTDDQGLGELGSSPEVLAIKELARIEESLKIISGFLPGTMAISMEFITVMRQLVPQGLAALNLGAPMGIPAGAPLPPVGMAPPGQPGMAPGGPMMMPPAGGPAGAGGPLPPVV